MNFMDKIKYLKDTYDKLDGMVRCHLSITNQRSSVEFVKKMKSLFSGVPQSYIDFLKSYDGLGLDWVTFYGSPDTELLSLLEIIELWKEAHDLDLVKLSYCPLGEDAGGNLFCLNPTNQVVMFDSEIYEEQEPRFIANSFDEFVNECILGKRYLEFMEEDNFYHFLQEQCWA